MLRYLNLSDKQKLDEMLSTKPKWMLIAEGELGTSEIIGKKHNKKILEYQKSTSLQASDDETPWCSAFVNWVMKQSGIPGTNLANARSWLNWGTAIKEPKIGCVVVLKRGNSAWQGHVGFFVGQREGFLKILGGNQGNKVSIQEYPKNSLLGFRWP